MPKSATTIDQFPGLEQADRALGQLRVAVGGTAEVLYQLPNTRTTAILRTITVANVHTDVVYIKIFLWPSGASPVYDEASAVWWNVELGGKAENVTPGNDFLHLDDLEWGLADTTARLAVECNVPDGATFTVFGREIVRT